LFVTAPTAYGLNNIHISKNITEVLPCSTGFSVKDNVTTVDFSAQKLDTRLLEAYYAKSVGKKGDVAFASFDTYLSTAGGKLYRPSADVNCSATSDIAALTYVGREYKDFSAKFTYDETNGGLMLAFGTKKGKFPITTVGASKTDFGAVVYQNSQGDKAEINTLGSISLYNVSDLPLYTKTVDAKGVGALTTHTLTVSVINGHGTVVLDDFGVVSTFDMSDSYDGGYISLVLNNAKNSGIYSLEITDLSNAKDNTLFSVENPRDITVLTDTLFEDIELPEAVNGTLKNGDNVKLSVNWDSTNYKTENGIYSVNGVLKSEDSFENPANLSATVQIKVKSSLPQDDKDTVSWTFDTDDDLRDFSSFYITDARVGTDKGTPKVGWYTKNGRLTYDPKRSISGSESTELKMLTYNKETYKNFELEVEFTQNYSRMLVLFGAKNIGQYIDYSNPKSTDNPLAVFVEFEGNRNIIGNVKNTNYYSRGESQVPQSRETPVQAENYYNKENKSSSLGTVHKMTIKVVGNHINIWLDDNRDNDFYAEINSQYDGGYISLLSASTGGFFDNLKITRLADNADAVPETKAITTGTDGLTIDSLASPKLSNAISGLYDYKVENNDDEASNNDDYNRFDNDYNIDVDDDDYYVDGDLDYDLDDELQEDGLDDGDEYEEQTVTKKVKVRRKKANSDSSQFPWLTVIIALAVVLLIGALLFVILFAKRKKNINKKMEENS